MSFDSYVHKITSRAYQLCLDRGVALLTYVINGTQ